MSQTVSGTLKAMRAINLCTNCDTLLVSVCMYGCMYVCMYVCMY